MLVKLPEHTWGLAQSWFIPDYTNWSNADFETSRAAVTAPLPDNRNQADYFTQTQSWHEQPEWGPEPSSPETEWGRRGRFFIY